MKLSSLTCIIVYLWIVLAVSCTRNNGSPPTIDDCAFSEQEYREIGSTYSVRAPTRTIENDSIIMKIYAEVLDDRCLLVFWLDNYQTPLLVGLKDAVSVEHPDGSEYISMITLPYRPSDPVERSGELYGIFTSESGMTFIGEKGIDRINLTNLDGDKVSVEWTESESRQIQQDIRCILANWDKYR